MCVPSATIFLPTANPLSDVYISIAARTGSTAKLGTKWVSYLLPPRRWCDWTFFHTLHTRWAGGHAMRTGIHD